MKLWYFLRLLTASILVNILLIYLTVEFIIIPMKEAAKGIAMIICENMKVKCDFKK